LTDCTLLVYLYPSPCQGPKGEGNKKVSLEKLLLLLLLLLLHGLVV
jgi:hypothetical protein